MAYDDDDGDVLDIDKAVGLESEDAEADELDGFHEVDPTTGSAVVAVVDDEDDEDDDLGDEALEGDVI